jgi:hypothetical protein
VIIALFVLVAAVSASVAPLFVYTTTLALFGLAHVLFELRYIDARFGRRISREIWIGAGIVLTAVVAVRLLRIVGLIGDAHPYIEMGLVTTLAALALPELFRRRRFVVGTLVVLLLGVGAAVSPALTLVILAVVHNATPIGFLVEKRGARVLPWCLIAFVGVPLVVASGLPRELLGLHFPNEAIFPSGPLAKHLYVYVPSFVANQVDAFAGAVCAQVLHYGAVIVLMKTDEKPLLPWPGWKVMLVWSAGLAVHFAVGFVEARALYGLAAGVHAWIEVPVLMLAFHAQMQRAGAKQNSCLHSATS